MHEGGGILQLDKYWLLLMALVKLWACEPCEGYLKSYDAEVYICLYVWVCMFVCLLYMYVWEYP